MIAAEEWNKKTRKEKKIIQSSSNDEPPRAPSRDGRATRAPYELGLSKLNSKERRKFSLEILSEALENINNEEEDDDKPKMPLFIKDTIRRNIKNFVEKEVRKKAEVYEKKINDLEIKLFKLANSVSDPSILSNSLWRTIEMNTKTGDKVRSEMKPYLQQNQQMQEQIDNVQAIAINNECRSLLEKMNYFVHNLQPNL